MNKQNQTKSFAFKLAAKQEVKTEQWKARDGVATAGCTFPSERYSSIRGKDAGVYC